MRTSHISATVLALALSPSAALAEPYTILANGDLVFNTHFSMRGVFNCSAWIPCSGSGTNSITFGSGENTASLTFTGADGAAQVGNTAVHVTLGVFEMTRTGSFVFPAPSPQAPVVSFDFTLTHSSPVEGSTGRTWYFGPGGNEFLDLYIAPGNWVGLPSGPNPAPFRYGPIVYTFSPFPFRLSNRFTTMGANVGAAPEPATLVLLGTGLAGGFFARRRRNKEEG